jgi:hypothetical protein
MVPDVLRPRRTVESDRYAGDTETYPDATALEMRDRRNNPRDARQRCATDETTPEPALPTSHPLGYHLKTGHTLSVQNRPTGLAEDVIVLPCCSVRLQGLGLSPRSGVSTSIPGVRLRRGRPLDPESRRRRAFFARHPYRLCFCRCCCCWFGCFCHWLSPGLPVLVLQLRGPHLRTWPWCRRRSSMAETAALSPSSFPQSSTGLFDVISVLARS